MWYSSWSPDTVDHFVFIAWALPHTYYTICFIMMEKSCESLWDANFTTWYSLPGECFLWKLRVVVMPCCHWWHQSLSLWQPMVLPIMKKLASWQLCFQNHTHHRICFTWMKKSHAALWDANLTSRYLLFDQCYHWKLRKSWYHNNSHGILNNEFILSLWRISGESLRCQPLGIHYQGCALFLLWDLLYHYDDSLMWAYV